MCWCSFGHYCVGYYSWNSKCLGIDTKVTIRTDCAHGLSGWVAHCCAESMTASLGQKKGPNKAQWIMMLFITMNSWWIPVDHHNTPINYFASRHHCKIPPQKFDSSTLRRFRNIPKVHSFSSTIFQLQGPICETSGVYIIRILEKLVNSPCFFMIFQVGKRFGSFKPTLISSSINGPITRWFQLGAWSHGEKPGWPYGCSVRS